MPTPKQAKYDRNNPNTAPPDPSDYTSRRDYDAAEIDCFHLTCERLVGEGRYSDFVKAGSQRGDSRSPQPATRLDHPRQASDASNDSWSASVRPGEGSAYSSPQTTSTPALSTSRSSPAHSHEHDTTRTEEAHGADIKLETATAKARPPNVLSVASLLSAPSGSGATMGRQSFDAKAPTADETLTPRRRLGGDGSTHEYQRLENGR